MDSDSSYSAKRLVLWCLLLWVVSGLFGHVVSFTTMVLQTHRNTQLLNTAPQKLSASALELQLKQMNVFGLADTSRRDLRCSERKGEWDYTCSFTIVKPASTRRMDFDVRVDGTHYIALSEIIPKGTVIPSSRQK